MKIYKKLEQKAGDYGTLKIEVIYTLGGMNFFSGRQNPRGYKLYLTPCEVVEHNGIKTTQTTLLGDTHQSGFYISLEEVQRKNQKRLEYWAEKIKPLADEIAKSYSAKEYQKINELVKS